MFEQSYNRILVKYKRLREHGHVRASCQFIFWDFALVDFLSTCSAANKAIFCRKCWAWGKTVLFYLSLSLVMKEILESLNISCLLPVSTLLIELVPLSFIKVSF